MIHSISTPDAVSIQQMKKQHCTDLVAPVKDDLIFRSYNLRDLLV